MLLSRKLGLFPFILGDWAAFLAKAITDPNQRTFLTKRQSSVSSLALQADK